MESDKIVRLIQQQEPLNEQNMAKLKEIVKKYPYFEPARILYLKSLKINQPEKLHSELPKAAVHIHNRARLFDFLHDLHSFADPQTQVEPHTASEAPDLENDATHEILEKETTTAPVNAASPDETTEATTAADSQHSATKNQARKPSEERSITHRSKADDAPTEQETTEPTEQALDLSQDQTEPVKESEQEVIADDEGDDRAEINFDDLNKLSDQDEPDRDETRQEPAEEKTPEPAAEQDKDDSLADHFQQGWKKLTHKVNSLWDDEKPEEKEEVDNEDEDFKEGWNEAVNKIKEGWEVSTTFVDYALEEKTERFKEGWNRAIDKLDQLWAEKSGQLDSRAENASQQFKQGWQQAIENFFKDNDSKKLSVSTQTEGMQQAKQRAKEIAERLKNNTQLAGQADYKNGWHQALDIISTAKSVNLERLADRPEKSDEQSDDFLHGWNAAIKEFQFLWLKQQAADQVEKRSVNFQKGWQKINKKVKAMETHEPLTQTASQAATTATKEPPAAASEPTTSEQTTKPTVEKQQPTQPANTSTSAADMIMQRINRIKESKRQLEDLDKKQKAQMEQNSTTDQEKKASSKRTLKDKNNQEIIDKFIDEEPSIQPADPDTLKEGDLTVEQTASTDDEIITESLARVYADQNYYSKAINVYEKLILKYPEKKAYFAQQINELKKKLDK